MNWLEPRIPCSNPRSPRTAFMWNALLEAQGPVLDIGCADDPQHYGHRVVHFDVDDWSSVYEARQQQEFVQGDVHELHKYFEPRSFDTVLLGDVVEHLYAPRRALGECARVARRALAFSVWKETRIADGPGLWLPEGQEACDADSREQGAEDREDWQRIRYPKRRGVSDDEIPHLAHIWQFDQRMVDGLVEGLEEQYGMRVVFYEKAMEVEHEGEEFYNWLALLEH